MTVINYYKKKNEGKQKKIFYYIQNRVIGREEC